MKNRDNSCFHPAVFFFWVRGFILVFSFFIIHDFLLLFNLKVFCIVLISGFVRKFLGLEEVSCSFRLEEEGVGGEDEMVAFW